MITINDHYTKLQSSYLFSDIAKRVAAFEASHPETPIIKLGIGDVTHPLPPACVAAMHAAVDEMASESTFRGYGPEQGYAFLREAIAEHDFAARGIAMAPDEIFVSDGSKCDTANIQELFDQSARVAIPDPVYPVYIDTNVMAGRTGCFTEGRYEGVTYLDATPENGFVPELPDTAVDLIYLCFPNNPTGATASHRELEAWVDYALRSNALILFDAAYESFIRDPELPHSIYEIDGAREVAIEFRSFSKSAGFTGTRCAFTVVPATCRAFNRQQEPVLLHALWNRRHTTKFNGVSYPVQRAAAAAYSPEGKAEVRELTDAYLSNAAVIRDRMSALGYRLVGGENSPYVWIETKTDSWAFFDTLLEEAAVVVTPGVGFGKCGQGYIRISAFNTAENVTRAMERISTALRAGPEPSAVE